MNDGEPARSIKQLKQDVVAIPAAAHWSDWNPVQNMTIGEFLAQLARGGIIRHSVRYRAPRHEPIACGDA